jgi:hypothetical protein
MKFNCINVLVVLAAIVSAAPRALPAKVLGGWLRASYEAGVTFSPFYEKGVQQFNVISLFTAAPTPEKNGNLVFSIGEQYSNLKQDIKKYREAGNVVTLTVGGAGYGMQFGWDGFADNCYNSLVRIIDQQLGEIDGITWNSFEQLRLSWAEINRMVMVSQKLRDRYGKEFFVTLPPSVDQSQHDYDLRVARQFDEAGLLAAVFPQFYDGPGCDSESTLRDRKRFWSSALGDSKFGYAMDFGYSVTTLSIARAAEIWKENTNSRGVFLFDIGKDRNSRGYLFSNTFAPLITGTIQPPPPTTATCDSPPRSDERCGADFGGAKCNIGYCCSQYGWCGKTLDHCNTNICKPSNVPEKCFAEVRADERCGPDFGNAKCKPGMCCSEHGWCGNTIDHCNKDVCNSGNSPAKCFAEVRADERCGPNFGNAKCKPDLCCSEHGWCGNTSDHCKSDVCRQ